MFAEFSQSSKSTKKCSEVARCSAARDLKRRDFVSRDLPVHSSQHLFLYSCSISAQINQFTVNAIELMRRKSEDEPKKRNLAYKMIRGPLKLERNQKTSWGRLRTDSRAG